MLVFPFLHICSVIFVDVGQLPNLYLTPGELSVSQPVSWCKFKSSGDNKHSFGRSKASTQLLMASWESRCTGRCSKITIDDRRLLINSTNFWSGKLWNFKWRSKYVELAYIYGWKRRYVIWTPFTDSRPAYPMQQSHFCNFREGLKLSHHHDHQWWFITGQIGRDFKANVKLSLGRTTKRFLKD